MLDYLSLSLPSLARTKKVVDHIGELQHLRRKEEMAADVVLTEVVALTKLGEHIDKEPLRPCEALHSYAAGMVRLEPFTLRSTLQRH